MVAKFRFTQYALLIAVLFLVLFENVDAAKKQKKAKASKKAKSVDKLRCGVCFAVIDEVLFELRKTENSTSTLDLRWGLTAEVTDGRAKRIGKVIPYKRSELRSIEIMEKVCDSMKDYAKFDGVPGETQLKRTFRREGESTEDYDKKNQQLQLKSDRDDQKKFERICEEFVEQNEALITETIRDELNSTGMENALCFGSVSAPCGEARNSCQSGSYNSDNGNMPCDLCPHGKYQPDNGQLSCLSCGEHENTTERGGNASSACIAQCKPGAHSSNGLQPCYDCGIGTFQPAWASKTCDSCELGLSTNSVGSVYITECVSICGDFRRSKDESCDDGNVYPGDGCSEKCVIEAGHRCDGEIGQSSKCSKVVCGDNKVETSSDGTLVETCDDNNTVDGDGCSATCTVEAGFVCPPSQSCVRVTCGDGLRHNSYDGLINEVCDDGNTNSGDGCSDTCQVEENALCDGPKDGKHYCHLMKCGDGYIDKIGDTVEQCDDSNTNNGDGCNDQCQIEQGWQCNEGSGRWGVFGPTGKDSSSRSRSTCKRQQICGDGFRVEEEKCDDGNTVDGDGCASNCTVEQGFTCSARLSDSAAAADIPRGNEALPDKCERIQAESGDNKDSGLLGRMFGGWGSDDKEKKDL